MTCRACDGSGFLWHGSPSDLAQGPIVEPCEDCETGRALRRTQLAGQNAERQRQGLVPLTEEGLGECDVQGCHKPAGCEWPMLNRRLCHKHNTRDHAPAGAFDGPDDFDIPD
jgi:hypothetical protein